VSREWRWGWWSVLFVEHFYMFEIMINNIYSPFAINDQLLSTYTSILHFNRALDDLLFEHIVHSDPGYPGIDHFQKPATLPYLFDLNPLRD